jgi:hypothetical protein
MRIRNISFNGRKAWEMDNGTLSMTMTIGGGHIAGLVLRDKPGINPMWSPIWKSIEPWNYNAKKHKDKYGLKLLAAIRGHNLCLGWFGDPSTDEASQGLETHGEAPIARWRLVDKSCTKHAMRLTCACELPVAQMKFIRTVTMREWSSVVDVKEQVVNLSKRDQPFTMCEHVTMGPPFLEKGVTLFDMPATRCATFPGNFGDTQRLKPDTAFMWPNGPGVNGQSVDMRMIGKEFKKSSDFTANLMDTQKKDAWFAAVNPRLGLLLAYVWRRADFPWIGNWEENHGRKGKPWIGKSLTRGMELTNSPFPVGLRRAVTMGRFQGQPTYSWLPAGGKSEIEYSIIYANVPNDVLGVKDIERSSKGFSVDLLR